VSSGTQNLDSSAPLTAAYRANLSNSTTSAVRTQITRWDTGNPQYISRSDGRPVSLRADSATKTYGYDSYGRTTTVRYPIYNDLSFTTQNNSTNIPATLTSWYDSMGRPSG
jgi:hypothetical protein